MAIFSGKADRKLKPRGNVLTGTVARSSIRSFPPLRVTGVVRLYGEAKKSKKV